MVAVRSGVRMTAWVVDVVSWSGDMTTMLELET
jgi:hypothetical protein